MTRTFTIATVALFPVALLACGGPRASRVPANATSPVAARARFAPNHGDAVFQRAVRVAALEGYRLSSCDADRRQIQTARYERDAPCGPTTCLARETLEVKLGYRMARVTVAREVYDGAVRTWRSDDGAGSAETARALLGRIVSGTGAIPAANPCDAAARVEVSSLGTMNAGQ